jgi:hypothetical protein
MKKLIEKNEEEREGSEKLRNNKIVKKKLELFAEIVESKRSTKGKIRKED